MKIRGVCGPQTVEGHTCSVVMPNLKVHTVSAITFDLSEAAQRVSVALSVCYVRKAELIIALAVMYAAAYGLYSIAVAVIELARR